MKVTSFFAILFASVLAMSFSACSDDDAQPEPKLLKISLSENTMILTHNDIAQLSVNEDVKVTWTSLNPFVATVDDNGLVIGNFVGSTVIEAKTADGLSDVCLVSVLPVYYTYDEPYIEWGKSKDDVLAGQDFATSCSSDGTEVSCNQGTGKYWSARYLIDPDKGLYYAELQINSIYEDEIHKFLGERYLYIGNKDGARYYVHGLSAESFDYSVLCYRVKHYSKTYIAVSYTSGDYIRSVN